MMIEGGRTIVRMTKSQESYCAFLSTAGVLKVCRLLRAIVSSSPRALKRAIAALKRRVHLGLLLRGRGGRKLWEELRLGIKGRLFT